MFESLVSVGFMKIVYCTDTICYPGGIQNVTISKANALSEIEGNEVWIVVTDNKKESIAYVNPKVHIIDLDVNYYEDDWKGRLYVLKSILVKRRLHQKKLSAFLNTIMPDIVVSTGTSEKDFLPSIKVDSHPSFIREIHFEKHYRKRAAVGFVSKLMAVAGDLYDYHYKIKQYHKIAILTQEDKDCNWNNDERLVVMPNPITSVHSYQSDCKNKIVIAAGRLVHQKNFSSLIRIWHLVAERHPDWHLQIWGSGELEAMLSSLIKDYNLQQQVTLMGYTKQLLKEMANASIFAMSSEFEGFGLVLVEAMSVNLPVVSYQCPAGPKDIITDGQDGFLIPKGDEVLFADRLCWLIEHDEERRQMGQMAYLKSQNYTIDKIISRWMQLFVELRNK